MVADLGLVVYNFAHSTVCTILLDIVGLNDELVLDFKTVEPNGGSQTFHLRCLPNICTCSDGSERKTLTRLRPFLDMKDMCGGKVPESCLCNDGESRDQLYKDRSSRKIDSRRLFSRE